MRHSPNLGISLTLPLLASGVNGDLLGLRYSARLGSGSASALGFSFGFGLASARLSAELGSLFGSVRLGYALVYQVTQIAERAAKFSQVTQIAERYVEGTIMLK